VIRRAITGALLAGALLAGCGGSDEPPPAPLGSAENPIEATAPSNGEPTSETAGEPGFEQIIEQQGEAPAKQDRANPCAWVTKREAQAILGAKLLDPVVAPQGPTCIYRDRAGKSFATISIQAQPFDRLRKQVKRAQEVQVSDATGYCGMHGQPVLYLRLAADRVLSVTAPCEIATRLARQAVTQLVS
jgi:hypothetical protein